MMLGLSAESLFEITPRAARPRRREYKIPLPLILPVPKDILPVTMSMKIDRAHQDPVLQKFGALP